MREILFRGKSVDSGDWLFGDYMGYGGTVQIWEQTEDGKWNAIVDPSTIGQYTGLTDKNGVKIFEGDIVQVENPKPFRPYIRTVSYEDAMFVWGDYRLGEFEHQEKLEVVGNIHDNPELLNDT